MSRIGIMLQGNDFSRGKELVDFDEHGFNGLIAFDHNQGVLEHDFRAQCALRTEASAFVEKMNQFFSDIGFHVFDLSSLEKKRKLPELGQKPDLTFCLISQIM